MPRVLHLHLRICSAQQGLRISAQNGKWQDVIIGAGVLPNGQTSTAEFEEVMRRSSVSIGSRVVSVPIERVVGGVSDNASGAVGVTKLYEMRKKEVVNGMSPDVVATATADQKNVWNAWHLFRCEMHKVALWSSHFVGGRLQGGSGARDPLFKVESCNDPDRCKMVHGRTEHYVQGRLTAWPHLRWGLKIFLGMMTLAHINETGRWGALDAESRTNLLALGFKRLRRHPNRIPFHGQL